LWYKLLVRGGVMSKREEFEAAFVEALADLAEAEAGLARIALDHSKLEPGPADGDADLEHARAACRQARARLLQLEREVPPPASDAPAEKLVRHEDKLPNKPSRRRITIAKLRRAFPSLHALDRALPGWRVMVRQSLMLLALVLAYLQYYFFDVQLEVSRLPSISVPLFG